MNITSFPVSRRLENTPSERLSDILTTAYAFYAYARQRLEKFDYTSPELKIGGCILGAFPIWYAGREAVDAPPGARFSRVINGTKYWFYRSNSEFVAIQFTALEGRYLEGDGTVFSHIEYNDLKIPRMSSTFIVSMELFTRLQLFLSEMGEQAAYPRIVVIPGTSHCGLLVTANKEAPFRQREHIIFPLPELSFGRANRRGDDFRESKMSLDQFVLSSGYPMKIDFANEVD